MFTRALFALLTLALAITVWVCGHGETHETVLLTARHWEAGAPVSPRLLVRHHDSKAPIADASIALMLLDEDSRVRARSDVRSDAMGTARIPMRAALAPGNYSLRVQTRSSFGDDVFEQRISVTADHDVRFTCDKPHYLPGETIRLHALVRGKMQTRPVADLPVTFKVRDGRGNLVFREALRSSQFGIASAEFALAETVNEGDYEIALEAGGRELRHRVRVASRQLPPFVLKVSLDQPWYVSGSTVKPQVRAEYPDGSEAEIRYQAYLELPKPSLEIPANQPETILSLHLTARDRADREVVKKLPVIVTHNPLSIQALPVSTKAVEGLPNRLLVRAIWADGRPVEDAVFSYQDERIPADVDGLAALVYRNAEPPQAAVQAVRDGVVHRAQLRSSQMPAVTFVQEGVLIQPERALVRAGESIAAMFESTSPGVILVDLLAAGQTVATEVVQLHGPRRHVRVPVPAGLSGIVELHAYRADLERPAPCVRRLQVLPAIKLAIKPVLDKEEYRPGETATLTIQATDDSGNPAQAALSISAVDRRVGPAPGMSAPAIEGVLLAEFALAESAEPTAVPEQFRRHYESFPEDYDHLRDQERYREVMAALDAGRLFRETGSRKAQAQRVFRKRVLVTVWSVVGVVLFGCFLALVLRFSRETGGQSGNSCVVYGSFADRTLGMWALHLVLYLVACQSRPLLAVVALFLAVATTLAVNDIRERSGALGAGVAERLRRMTAIYLAAYGLSVLALLAGLMNPEFYGAWLAAVLFAQLVMAATVGSWAKVGTRWSLLKLLVVVAAIAVLSGMLLPSLSKTREKSRRINAAGNLKQIELGLMMAEDEAARTRRHFPETLFWAPEIITDADGQAQVPIEMADSITMWNCRVDAIDARGGSGLAEFSVRCFQPVVIDVSPPADLTIGDQLEIPVLLRNHSATTQRLQLRVECEGLSLPKEFEAELAPESTQAIQLPVLASKVGEWPLRISAAQDAVEYLIRVGHGGDVVEHSRNLALKDAAGQGLHLPAEAIANSAILKLHAFPGRMAELQTGLESIFRKPHGCFEQSSSITYPNILAMRYLQRTGQADAQIASRALQHIRQGYQRLLTFEVRGGGFSLYGKAPASPWLTAYGLMQLSELADFVAVDPAVVARTREWLRRSQEPDGSWKGSATANAFTLWALATAGENGPTVTAASDYLGGLEVEDSYLRALLANALMAAGLRAEGVLESLAREAVSNGQQTHWRAKTGLLRSGGVCADVEVTALAALAMLEDGQSALGKQALAWLSHQRDPGGGWGSTLATVLSLQALLAGEDHSQGESHAVEVFVNDRSVGTLKIRPQDEDLLRSLDLSEHLRSGENTLHLSKASVAPLNVQVAFSYAIPGPARESGRLRIQQEWQRSQLRQGQSLRGVTTVYNDSDETLGAPIVELPIPPGFVVDQGRLRTMAVSRVEFASLSVRLYLGDLAAGASRRFSYDLRAAQVGKVQAGAAEIYAYYHPERRAESANQVLEVLQ